MVENKKPSSKKSAPKKPTVKKPTGVVKAAVGLTIDGNFFEAGEVVTEEVPDWMILQKLIIEEDE